MAGVKGAVGALLLLVPMVFSSCAVAPGRARLALQDEGEVFIYIQPFPQEADRLYFSLSGVSAVRSDGEEFPLVLRQPELNTRSITRQQLFCSGTLPPGDYAGFSFGVVKASLKSEEGDASLLVPEKPVKTEFPFRVVQRKAEVLYLEFNYARSVRDGFSFSPVFSIFYPLKPVTAVLGFVSNHASYDLTIVDKNIMHAVGVVATQGRPGAVALDQRQRRLYVALENDVVEVIDAATREVLNTLRLHLGDSPGGVALTPDGRSLLTANAGSNTVSMIDAVSLLETARISVANDPESVLVDRTGRRAYVFNTRSDSISVIDIANRALVTTLSTDPAPVWGQFNAKGDRLYVIHGLSSYMTVIDPLSLAVLSRVYVGVGMSALKVDPQTDLIYAGRRNDTMVEIYDPVSLVPFDYIAAGVGPAYMTIDGEENNLWVLGGTGKLIVVNLVNKKVVSEIDVGEEPFWLAMMGER